MKTEQYIKNYINGTLQPADSTEFIENFDEE